jgi:YYY domain-containing protein
MIETLRWWLAATLIGLIAAPYAFRLFRFLPDRGYAFARALGILAVVYVMWILSVLGLASFGTGTAILLLGLMAAGALWLAGRDRAAIAAHLRERWPLMLAAELVFALFLFAVAYTRAFQPAIADTEKPFEFAFFNGVLHSARMPAQDPWYGGAPMSYYYGGYLIVALFTRITGVVPAIAFNLGVALTGGLTAVSAFGLGANLLVTLRQRARRAVAHTGSKPAIVAGCLSVFLLLMVGSLEGVFEFTAAHGWGSAAFYQRLGIDGLTAPYHSVHWWPDEFWFWWRATRMGSGWNVLEFPFFSFLLGDLHAHVMVLPLSLLGLAGVLNLIASGRPAGWQAVRRDPLTVLFFGVLAGMLALVNSWDQPIFLMLLFAATLALNIGRRGLSPNALAGAGAYVLPAALLSVVLYLPFFVYLHAATQGIYPVELAHLPSNVNGEGMVFPPHHFLLFWGPLLIIAAGAIVLEATRRRVWRAPSEDRWLAWGIAVAPLILWALVVTGWRLADSSAAPLLTEIRLRATWWAFGSYWLVQLGLVALIGLSILALLAEAHRDADARRPGRIFLLLALAMAFGLVHGMELFYVKEPSSTRINTVFKFSYTAWLLLATTGGAALVDAALSWRPRPRRAFAIPAWGAATAVVLLLSLVYPVGAMMNRTNGFSGDTTLDGLAWLRTSDPDEYNAVRWLSENLPGRPAILEAPGNDYSQYGRVSARTGFPTVIGWQFHEAQERGGRDYDAKITEVVQRAADVDTIYRTADIDEARRLLSRYNIAYVYAGRLEIERYGAQSMDKFTRLGHVVYQGRSVTLYAVDSANGEGGPALGSRP